ncbi:MAG: class I SAM-dependent methyltransferase [Paracoccaceae bacterium]|nr:MAG: class I SAM-dependent methyltransferase [Paracoccaceae bacterium]
MTSTDQESRPAATVSDADLQRLAQHLLKRSLRPGELANWLRRAERERLGFAQAFDLMVASPEYQSRAGVDPEHPPGHYYSPIVNPAEVRTFFSVDRRQPIDSVAGLSIRDADLRAEFDRLRPFISSHRFPKTKTEGARYYTENGIFTVGDAIVLAAMIARHRPKRIIEIGSGFSTACMLDTIERLDLPTAITCIEPNPARLRRNLTERDAERVTIVEGLVQGTDPAMYETLESGDFLFIDSTHVVKTGSDVCFEMFEILPRLKPGVVVHVHDIHHPFEYPDAWIFEKRRSWNEVYILRAFLMYNHRFPVTAFNNYFLTRYRKDVEEAYGEPVMNAGGSIWMQVQQ